MAGMTRTVSSVDEASPNSSEIAGPWKIRFGEDDGGTDHRRERGEQDRLEADRVRLDRDFHQCPLRRIDMADGGSLLRTQSTICCVVTAPAVRASS